MPIVGGLDIHRKQITFDYLDTETGQVQRGQITPADREHLRAWLARFAGRDDVQHRKTFFELADAARAARAAGDLARAARIDAQADACRQPSACGHWPRGVYGASCDNSTR